MNRNELTGPLQRSFMNPYRLAQAQQDGTEPTLPATLHGTSSVARARQRAGADPVE